MNKSNVPGGTSAPGATPAVATASSGRETTEVVSSKTVNLPTYDECANAVAGGFATPLQAFIYSNEPSDTGIEGFQTEAEFREQLAQVIAVERQSSVETSARREYHARGVYWSGVPTEDMPCDFCGLGIVAHDPRTHACPPAETPAPLDPQPIPVTEIVAALEREACNTDTDPKWLAALEMRRMLGWEGRTLMCRIDQRPSLVQSPVKSTGEAP